jgi:hypothetical protein
MRWGREVIVRIERRGSNDSERENWMRSDGEMVRGKRGLKGRK